VRRFAKWKTSGYRIEIAYLKIDSPQIGLKRIAARVKQGGHDIPRDAALRRFGRSWANFDALYRSLADRWWVYDNSGVTPKLLEHGP
jgi:predicted ABC-type ATPase